MFWLIKLIFGVLVFNFIFWTLFIGWASSQQSTRTTCYRSGNDRICETFDQYGALLSKSRCYRSGRDERCDTQTFSGTPQLGVPYGVAPR